MRIYMFIFVLRLDYHIVMNTSFGPRHWRPFEKDGMQRTRYNPYLVYVPSSRGVVW